MAESLFSSRLLLIISLLLALPIQAQSGLALFALCHGGCIFIACGGTVVSGPIAWAITAKCVADCAALLAAPGP